MAASAKDRDPDAERAEEEPVAEAAEPEAPAEEELTVKTVETVSPMDLVMGSREDEPERPPRHRTIPRAAPAEPPDRRPAGPGPPVKSCGPLPSGRAGQSAESGPGCGTHGPDRHF